MRGYSKCNYSHKKLANRYFLVTKTLSRNAFCNWVFVSKFKHNLTARLDELHINPKVDLVVSDKKPGKKSKKPSKNIGVTPDLHFELLYGNYQLKEKDRQGITRCKSNTTPR